VRVYIKHSLGLLEHTLFLPYLTTLSCHRVQRFTVQVAQAAGTKQDIFRFTEWVHTLRSLTLKYIDILKLNNIICEWNHSNLI